MHNPIAAFAWELWRKNQRRLILIFGVLTGFIIFYPRLCATAGFNPANSFSIDEFARNFHPMSNDEPMVLRIGRALFFLFLLAGPITAMFLSLLCVVWMFTVLEFDPMSKNSPSIPGRLFTLPISTSFLFLTLFMGGTAMIFVVFEGWTQFVRMPYLDVFGEYQKCFGWMAFLALSQAIVWSLAGWPVTRFVLSLALLGCFMSYPAWENPLSTQILLPFLFLGGVSFAAVGLQKMRHGQWQGWTWNTASASAPTLGRLRGPQRFASPAQAQLWFEWRRFARNLCLFIAGFSLVPEMVHLLVRLIVGRQLQVETLFGFTVILFTMPLILHGLGAMSPVRANHSFLMNRPLTGGEMMMAVLKAAAISTVLSWVFVFIAILGMPLLGDFNWVKRHFLVPPEYQTPIGIGLIFLTWSFCVTNLCFARSGSKWLTDLPVLMFLGPIAVAVLIVELKSNDDLLYRLLILAPSFSAILSCLLAAKLLLAFVGFRAALKRGFLTPSGMFSYLTAWVLMVAALLIVALHMQLPSREWMLPMSLGIVLLVPLARISFCPIALEHSRQT